MIVLNYGTDDPYKFETLKSICSSRKRSNVSSNSWILLIYISN